MESNFNTKKIFGVKGFTKELKCGEYQFKIGETFTLDEKPHIGSTGFHFWRTLDKVFNKYPKNSDNRYCIVEILGDIDKGVDKSSTNKIKIVREIFPNSSFKHDLMKKKYSGEYLSKLNDLGFVVGGSVALAIHGYSFNRDLNEIDLVMTSKDYNKRYDEIHNDIFNGFQVLHRNSGIDSATGFVGIFNEKYDMLIQNDETIPTVIRNVDGYDVKIVDEYHIWNRKLAYALQGSIKHMEDIRLNGVQFIMKSKKIKSKDINKTPF